MQTFLPYPDFNKSARCLDYRRLGKQRVEAYQILKVLLGLGKRNKNGNMAWENHPAVKMWKGHEFLLLAYILYICTEWKNRGYKDSIIEKAQHLMKNFNKDNYECVIPIWYYDEKFHASHRSNLLRKDKEYYSKFGWTEPDDLPYIWPTK